MTTSGGKTLVQKCNRVEEFVKLQRQTPQNCFRYRHPPTAGWFRLLILEPSSDPQYRISCRLSHAPIRGVQNYEALSYTCGTDTAVAPILIDDLVALVRYNLFQALKHLRSSTEQRVLWIDALCIDQSNIDERESQVSQMTQIYSNARGVVVWLQESDEYTDSAMDCLAEITPQAKLLEENATSPQKLYNVWVDLFSSLHARSDSDKVFLGLCILLRAPWWSRVWTLQEIVLAREATIQVGHKNISWECLEIASKLCTAHQVHTHLQRPAEWSAGYKTLHSYLPSLLVKADTIRNMRQQERKNKRPLSQMVELSLSRHASDPRDKIYGVLGLVENGCKPSISYQANCVEVYKLAFKTILESFRDLRVYNFLQEMGSRKTEGLPSWIPDFAGLTETRGKSISFVGGESENDMVASVAKGLLYYAASLVKGRLTRRRIKFSDNDSFLNIKGIPIDIVRAVGSQAPEKSKNGRAFDSVISEWSSIPDCKSSEYVAGGSYEEAFWRAALLDCKVIGYHKGISLRHNPRNRGRRLDRPDNSIPPPDQVSRRRLMEAMDRQIDISESMQKSRSFFTTEKGYMGMTLPTSRTGDLVCVLFGGEVPYVLRPIRDGTYKMIGQW